MPQVMVLAAGHGTRLQALTAELPKPLIPLGRRPVLRHLLDTLAAHEIREVVLNTHHLAAHFDDFDPGQIQLIRSYEPELLGTAGGVAAARQYLEEHCVVWNSDILIDPPLHRLLEAARVGGLTLLVSGPAYPVGHGTVGLDASSRVVRLRGERFGEEVAGCDYVGLAALGAAVMRRLPQRGCLVGDVCLPRLRAGEPISTVTHSGDWSDIGTPSAYLEANRVWLRRGSQLHFVGEGATVAASVELSETVIGAGSEVGGSGALQRCVVWPGARVSAPLRDAIVLRSGRVVHVE